MVDGEYARCALSKAYTERIGPAVDWVSWSAHGKSKWAGLNVYWLARDQGRASGSPMNVRLFVRTWSVPVEPIPNLLAPCGWRCPPPAAPTTWSQLRVGNL